MNKILYYPCIMLSFLMLSLTASADNKETTTSNPHGQQESANTEQEVAIKKEILQPSSFWGGLVLTKVELERADNLEPFADTDAGDYHQKCEDLIGLVIYHLGNNTMQAGVYVWCGKEWRRINQ